MFVLHVYYHTHIYIIYHVSIICIEIVTCIYHICIYVSIHMDIYIHIYIYICIQKAYLCTYTIRYIDIYTVYIYIHYINSECDHLSISPVHFIHSKNAPCRRPFLVFGAWGCSGGPRAWRQIDLPAVGYGNSS